MKRWYRWSILVAIVVLAFAGNVMARQNLIENGSVEWDSPYFWDVEATGGDLIWATDEAEQGLRSLKISKTATGTAASWKTYNQAQMFWNRMVADLYTVSFYAKTDGVNTSPADQDASIGTIWTFFDESGAAIGDPLFVAVDQTSATSDWAEYTAQIALTAVPAEAYCEAVMGSEATGTVWYDHFNYSAADWSAGFFGGGCEDPDGWMSWYSTGDVGFAAVVEDENAHSGNHVVKLQENDELTDEMVFYTIPYTAEASTEYIVGVWVKTEGMNVADNYFGTNAISENIADRANLCFFFHGGDIVNDWVPLGDQFVYFDQRTETVDEWTMYWTIVTSPEDATGISMRARFNSTVQGTILFDDFFCYEVEQGENIVNNADLETVEPYFWNEEANGGTLTWAEDEFENGLRSLKIEKTATSSAASWKSDNQAQKYWNRMIADLYTVSFYAKTDGVNTAPADQDASIGTIWTFFDESGAAIGDPLFVAVDQTSATSDWAEYTGQIALTAVPAEAYCEAIMGINATGTVWFDHFNYSAAEWSAGFFGGGCEDPEGYMNWYSTGDVGFAATVNVGEDAHSGNIVAKLKEEDENTDEMVFYTVPYSVEANTWYEFSVWTKSSGMAPVDTMYYPSGVMSDNVADRANLCFFFHGGDIENDWVPLGDRFIYLQQIETDEDWTLYRGVALAPEEATGASMRARFNSTVQGEVWFDDFSIRPLNQVDVSVEDNPGVKPVETIPSAIQLHQNYPNPFNAMTNISYVIPSSGHVTLAVYDLLGREVTRLVDQSQVAGSYKVLFSGENFTSGVYFYRLSTDNMTVTRKMMFIK